MKWSRFVSALVLVGLAAASACAPQSKRAGRSHASACGGGRWKNPDRSGSGFADRIVRRIRRAVRKPAPRGEGGF